MKDPWNPENKKLRAWAFDTKAPWPTQDFDLAVGDLHLADIIIELASNDNCPKQLFFLSCAYLIVGDAVRTYYQTAYKDDINDFLVQAKQTNNAHLLKLVKHSEKLMQNPTTFNYEQWCNGGFK